MYSSDQITELLKCRDSFSHFCQSQLQLEALNIIPHEQNHTTLEQSFAYLLWQSIFCPNSAGLVISKSVTRRCYVQLEFANLANRLDEEIFTLAVTSKTSRSLVEIGSSKVFFQTGKNAGRGFSINTLVFDGAPIEGLQEAILPSVCSTKGTVLYV